MTLPSLDSLDYAVASIEDKSKLADALRNLIDNLSRPNLLANVAVPLVGRSVFRSIDSTTPAKVAARLRIVLMKIESV